MNRSTSTSRTDHRPSSHDLWLFGETSPPGDPVSPDGGSQSEATPHILSPPAPGPAMQWQCPENKMKKKIITKQNWLSSNTNNDKDSGTAHKYNWDYLIQDWDLLRSWLTDTILPSEGMNAGRLLMRSLVWRVLKLISSWHFSCTLGGLCWRL